MRNICVCLFIILLGGCTDKESLAMCYAAIEAAKSRPHARQDVMLLTHVMSVELVSQNTELMNAYKHMTGQSVRPDTRLCEVRSLTLEDYELLIEGTHPVHLNRKGADRRNLLHI